MNDQINEFEISLFKEPNCKNILKNEYIFYIDEKERILKINDDSNFNAD